MWAAPVAVHISTARPASRDLARPEGYSKGLLTMPKSERRSRLTATRKLELYLATRAPEAPVGAILCQYGIHLDDLREIERQVESSALAGLKAHGRRRRQPTDVSPARVQQLEQELAETTAVRGSRRALAELSLAYTLLEKRERAESRARVQANGSPKRRSK